MGRRKIEIQPITHERNRSVTFLKRKNGLFKKAYELGVLCSVDVAVIVFEERPGHHTKLYQYCSSDIHNIIHRHLHHDGEKDTRGPADFSGNAPGTKDDAGEADEDDVDDDVDDNVPPVRGSKRRSDGQLKQSDATDLVNTDSDYLPSRMSLSQPQHAPRQLSHSMSMSQHHHQQHQHPISSDRLGPMHHHQSNKKPRLGLAPSPGLAHSRSDSDDPSGSPVSGSRSARYPHTGDPLGRSFGVSAYMPHHAPQSAHPHTPASASHHHHRHQQPQYHTPFFAPSSAPGGYGQGGGATPPPPNFIPLQSQADFTSSVRARSASSGAGVLPSRNVYGSYGGDSAPGSGGGGSGHGGDLFAAFLDAEQQARTSLPRRNSASSGAGPGAGGAGAFGLDWPVHVPAATASGAKRDDANSKTGSQSSSERGGEREREDVPAGPGPTARLARFPIWSDDQRGTPWLRRAAECKTKPV
ncbi:putative MADS [Lyophyllum shimeji]|uniref:MADS n=1 Tax=Lyophyllum shimeji TaxID=47721 RepID=A0A9P3PNC2_LYOSH|nr:putative MADS [Lyophyllum shimeji]